MSGTGKLINGRAIVAVVVAGVVRYSEESERERERERERRKILSVGKSR